MTSTRSAARGARAARAVISWALIASAALLAYSNSLRNPFHYDDIPTIVENRSLRSLDPASVWRANNRLRFLGFYSFAIDRAVFGPRRMAGRHAVNIGLHIACALLLYALVCVLRRADVPSPPGAALVAALLFAAHPLLSEPVNYIQARLVLLYTAFTLAAVLSAVRLSCAAGAKAKAGWLLLIAAALAGGGLSKEVGLFYVPAGIGVYLLVSGKKAGGSRRALLLLLLPAAAAALLAAGSPDRARLVFGRTGHPAVGEYGFAARVLTESRVFWKTLALLVPDASGLSVDHHVAAADLSTPRAAALALVPLLGLGALLSAGLLARKRYPFPSFCLFWMLMGTLPYLPAAGTAEFMVEYKFYLPAAGCMGIAAWALAGAASALGRRCGPLPARAALVSATGLLLAVCVRETRERNLVWGDPITLWSDAIAKAPSGSWLARNNLGASLAKQGRHTEAIAQYRAAMAENPYDAGLRSNVGRSLAKTGRKDDAIALFREALRLNPRAADAMSDIGTLLSERGQTDEAIRLYGEAIAIDPLDPVMQFNLAHALAEKGLASGAIARYREAIRLDPGYAEAHNNLGAALLGEGDRDGAILHYREAIRLEPRHPRAHYNLGLALMRKGDGEGATAEFEEAVRITPDDPDCRHNLRLAREAAARTGSTGTGRAKPQP